MGHLLLTSDLFPLLVFTSVLLQRPSASLAAVAASRLCSLVYHLRPGPRLINLDYIGIASMSAVSFELGMPAHCDALLALALAAAALTFVHGLATGTHHPHSQRLILLLALLGHAPAAAEVLSGHPGRLGASAALLGVGYFAVEPVSHVAWHWLASMAQAALVL